MSTDLRPCPEHGMAHKYRTAHGEQRCRQCQREAEATSRAKRRPPLSPRQLAARRGREARAVIATLVAIHGGES